MSTVSSTPGSPASKKVKVSEQNGDVSQLVTLSQFTGTVIHWFRSDLRIMDNPALNSSSFSASSKNRPLLALYILSPSEWLSHYYSPIRADFHLRNLRNLKKSLNDLNIKLLVHTCYTAVDVIETVLRVANQFSCKEMSWNIEYEVDEGRRDKNIKDRLMKIGVNVVEKHDQSIVPPGNIKSKQGNTYSVFTPFKKSWIAYVEENPSHLVLSPSINPNVHNLPIDLEALANQVSEIPEKYPQLELENEVEYDKAKQNWPTGEITAHEMLSLFMKNQATQYKNNRDFPSLNATSKLSPYLAAGVLSTRQCMVAARSANKNKLATGNDGLVTWISEIIWREFYREILVEWPRVCMNKPFKLETQAVRWRDDDDGFQKWCEGKTGYPIVDAGMRQLKETGWMHNRVRMITAMFLCKDLLVDWRKGEKYFMQHLIDGDFASNNGGWQWCASTGTDSQPYFRVFNPKLQSEKNDANGNYIRQWVSELKGVKGKQIHDPFNALSQKEFSKLNYPKPIVDHKMASKRAIEEFKRALSEKDSSNKY